MSSHSDAAALLRSQRAQHIQPPHRPQLLQVGPRTEATANIEDSALAALHHARDHRSAHCDAAEVVGVHEVPRLVNREVHQGLADGDSRVVHEDCARRGVGRGVFIATTYGWG